MKLIPNVLGTVLEKLWQHLNRENSLLQENVTSILFGLETKNRGKMNHGCDSMLNSLRTIGSKMRIAYRIGLIFLKENRSEVYSLFVKTQRVRSQIREKIRTLKKFAQDRTCSLDDVRGQVESILSEIEREAILLEASCDEFRVLLDRSIGELLFSFPNQDFGSCFIRSEPSYSDTLEYLLGTIFITRKDLQIMTPMLDHIHALILTTLLETNNELSTKLLLRYPHRNGYEMIELLLSCSRIRNLETKVNFDLHSRVLLSDQKRGVISSADLNYLAYYGHIEAGVSFDQENLLKNVAEFFEQIWDNSIELEFLDKPIRDYTKAIVQYRDKNSRDRPGDLVEELHLALGHADPWIRIRFSPTVEWAYIDSRHLSPLRICRTLSDFDRLYIVSAIPVEIHRNVANSQEIIQLVESLIANKSLITRNVNIEVVKLSDKPTIDHVDRIKQKIADKLRDIGFSVRSDSKIVIWIFLYEQECLIGLSY